MWRAGITVYFAFTGWRISRCSYILRQLSCIAPRHHGFSEMEIAPLQLSESEHGVAGSVGSGTRVSVRQCLPGPAWDPAFWTAGWSSVAPPSLTSARASVFQNCSQAQVVCKDTQGSSSPAAQTWQVQGEQWSCLNRQVNSGMLNFVLLAG